MPLFTTVAGVTAMTALGTALTATAAGAAIGYGVSSAMSQGESNAPSQALQVTAAPTIPTLAPAPTPEKAEDLAKIEIEKQRRMRALAGGKTILAEGGPTLTEGAGKTLLGS